MRIRLDERLIHGQVIAGAVKFYRIKKILIVSKNVKNDEVRKRLMSLAVPFEIELDIMDATDFLQVYNDFQDDQHILVLFEDLNELIYFLKNSGYRGEIYLANYHSKEVSIRLRPTLTLSEEEYKELARLSEAGVKFMYKLTPQHRDETLFEGVSR